MFDPEKRDYTLGAIEVGTTVSAILYGMVLVQGRMYSMASMTDQQWMKMLVLLVMLLETLHMVSMITYVYYATVSHMDPSALMAVKWFTVINIALSNLIGSPVQAYFTWRAWIVSGRAWYATPPWYAEVARTMLVIASCVLLAESETITQFNITRANLITSALASCLLIDLWNSAVLCYHLKRKRIAFEKTLKYVNSIVIWSIETSLLICALAGFSLVFWLVMPQNAIWLAFLMVHAKIYSNSMMISLNGRIIRKAKTARPQDLQRSWELGHHRSPSGAHSSGTQQDSGAFMLHSDDSPQFALVNCDSKFSIPTSLYSPRLSSTSHTAGIRPLPKLVEDV